MWCVFETVPDSEGTFSASVTSQDCPRLTDTVCALLTFQCIAFHTYNYYQEAEFCDCMYSIYCTDSVCTMGGPGLTWQLRCAVCTITDSKMCRLGTSSVWNSLFWGLIRGSNIKTAEKMPRTLSLDLGGILRGFSCTLPLHIDFLQTTREKLTQRLASFIICASSGRYQTTLADSENDYNLCSHVSDYTNIYSIYIVAFRMNWQQLMAPCFILWLSLQTTFASS